MNRTIKFRGKSLVDIGNIKKGDWVYGGITYNDDRFWIDIPYIGQVLVDPETIGQFTELYDKNEKEIWGNDIVEITREGIYEKGIIKFKNCCFFIKSKENLLALYNCELNNYKVKVIGNITELLGGEDE